MTTPYRRDSVESLLSDHQDRIGAIEAIPTFAYREIKVFADDAVLTTGDSKFVFVITDDLESHVLIEAQAFVSTVASAAVTTVQIRNVVAVVDMLTTPITIDVGLFSSYVSTVPSLVDPATSSVTTGDLVAIDCDIAGTGSMGLGVILKFGVS